MPRCDGPGAQAGAAEARTNTTKSLYKSRVGREQPAAAPVSSGDTPAAIVAGNLKLIRKNTLIGTVDLTITSWRFVFRSCLWHQKGEREWINFPAKEWTDRTGARKFSNIGEFINHDAAQRFRAAALAAVHELADRLALGGTR